MSSSISKPVQINTNRAILKVDPLSSGPPRYRPPPQPQSQQQPPKSQNYLVLHNENSAPIVNAEQFNQFQAINEVNRYA